MSDPPKYFNDHEISRVLNWPLVISAVETALVSVWLSKPDPDIANSSYVIQPLRSLTNVEDVGRDGGGDRVSRGILFTMPGFVGNYKLRNAAGEGNDTKTRNTLACKLVTSFPNNQSLPDPLPNIMANILLFNHTTGKLQAILDGTEITTWRTAAASIAATKCLYFRRFGPQTKKERAITLAIIGCGVQGQIHALGMCASFDVSNIYLWNRTMLKAQQLALRLTRETHANIHIVETPGNATRNADVICIATFATDALIRYENVSQQRHVHINAVGAGQVNFGEVAADIYDKAKVYVDSWTSANTELKGLKANIVGEVGEVIAKNHLSLSIEGITIFQSMGMAAEDACVAEAVYDALTESQSNTNTN